MNSVMDRGDFSLRRHDFVGKRKVNPVHVSCPDVWAIYSLTLLKIIPQKL